VAKLDVLCELCLPFVRVGGCFAAFKSGDCEEEAEQAAGAISLLGGKRHKIIRYEAGGMSRAVVLINKIKNTSSKYPRQFSKIIKTPLI
jgi:16S rRNA (guanine527-N7)-methyltransferase